MTGKDITFSDSMAYKIKYKSNTEMTIETIRC